MRRWMLVVVSVCVAASTGSVLAACSPSANAQDALARGNAALARYAKAEDVIAGKIAQAAAVQPSPSGVKPGLALLVEVGKAMPARRQAALTAKKDFEDYKAAAGDARQKAYADKAIALAGGLVALDNVTTKLTADMTGLYTAVVQNSADTARVVALADAVSKDQAAYDKARADVKTLSDSANQYFEQNLAGKK